MSIQTFNGLTVAVWMITYNHEKFIAQAIDGVMMQQSSFAFKLFIGEDCSTDQTRAICIEYKNKYPDKLELLLNDQNIGASANSFQLLEYCAKSGAKYIALCEGDDYWTDPLKLQKQVDFLEENSEVSICGHVSNVLYEDIEDVNRESEYTRPQKMYIGKHLNFEDIVQMITENGPTFHTSSYLFHREKLKLPFFFNKLSVGDYAVLMLLVKEGKAFVLPSNCSTYRKQSGGITTAYQRNKITISRNRITFFTMMGNYLGEGKNPMIQKKIIEGYRGLCNTYFEKKQYIKFFTSLISFFSYNQRASIKFCYLKIKNRIGNKITTQETNKHF